MKGVNVARSRIEKVVFGNSLLRDRDEEEVRGYQHALRWIHEEHSKISLSAETILELRKLCKGDVGIPEGAEILAGKAISLVENLLLSLHREDQNIFPIV